MPVQYSYTFTPLSAFTVQLYLYSPQYLYSTAIPLLALWALRSVQSLSACTRAHLYLYLFLLALTEVKALYILGCHCPCSYFQRVWKNRRYYQ